MGDWSRGESYAQDIIENLENWAIGWMDWNFCLSEKGGPNWVRANKQNTLDFVDCELL